MTAPAPLMLSVSGCRGILGQSMTPEVAARFGSVFGSLLRERSPSDKRPLVILGRDGRAGGDILARAAGAGLAGAGCDVLDCGVAMTPTIGVMADIRNAAGGLIITASHNPQEWNGLKALVRSSDAPPAAVSTSAPAKPLADELIARFRSTTAHSPLPTAQFSPGTIAPCASGAALGLPSEATHAHVERVRDALGAIGCTQDRRWQAIKCIVDSVNASGTSGAKALLGPNIIHHLGSSDSGIFPHTPEPTKDNLTTLARFTAEKRASAGFAQDPDADRMAIIDERGTYIGEDYTLVLAAEAVLGADPARSTGATVCVNLSTSRMIDDVAARHGARVVRTPVGEAHVVEAMKREKAILGGEGNGGVIWPRVTYVRDSLSAMGLLLALMTRTGKSISQLVADIPAYSIVKRKVDLRDQSEAAKAVEAVARNFASAKVDRQDGVRVDIASRRAWLHVRASNTEPIMRLIAEAPTDADATALLDEAAAAISKA